MVCPKPDLQNKMSHQEHHDKNRNGNQHQGKQYGQKLSQGIQMHKIGHKDHGVLCPSRKQKLKQGRKALYNIIDNFCNQFIRKL